MCLNVNRPRHAEFFHRESLDESNVTLEREVKETVHTSTEIREEDTTQRACKEVNKQKYAKRVRENTREESADRAPTENVPSGSN